MIPGVFWIYTTGNHLEALSLGNRFWDEALPEAPEPWEWGCYEVQMGFGSERLQHPPLPPWNSWKSPRNLGEELSRDPLAGPPMWGDMGTPPCPRGDPAPASQGAEHPQYSRGIQGFEVAQGGCRARGELTPTPNQMGPTPNLQLEPQSWS